MNDPAQAQPPRPRWWRSWWLRLAIVVLVAAGGLVFLAWKYEVWRSGLAAFFTSTGFGGLCALGAAGVAWLSVRRQVDVAERNLALQRDTTAKTLEQQQRTVETTIGQQRSSDYEHSWWDRLEWTVDRALPTDKDAVPLAVDAALSTLTQLQKMAGDDLQRATVGAVTDALLARREALDRDAMGSATPSPRPDAVTHPDSENLDPITPDSDEHAATLERYSKTAGDSPARSRRVNDELYRNEVAKALHTMLGADVRQLRGYPAFIVRRGQHRLMVITSSRKLAWNDAQLVRVVRDASMLNSETGVLLLENVPSRDIHLASAEGLLMMTTGWTSEAGTEGLEATIDEAFHVLALESEHNKRTS